MEQWTYQIQDVLKQGGAVAGLIIALFSLVASLILKIILKVTTSQLRRITQQTISIWGNVGLDIVDGLKTGVLFTWIFYVLSPALLEKNPFKNLFLTVVVIVTIIQVAIWGFYVIRVWRKTVLEKRIIEDPSSAAALGLLHTAIQVFFFCIVLLIGLNNLGIDITALIAGLGVGGIAVALAAQNVLGDLLASLSIVLDKPFEVGDFIVTGQEKGTVEDIGIKTTRLRSLSGEQLILSNKDILESRIQNYKRLWTRRVVQKFGILYSTSADQIEQIPGWVEEIITRQNKLKFDRCHFASFGTSSLDFEFVFFVNDPDYNIFMNLQQTVLLEIFRKFQQEKIEFAFPTQTLHVESIRIPT